MASSVIVRCTPLEGSLVYLVGENSLSLWMLDYESWLTSFLGGSAVVVCFVQIHHARTLIYSYCEYLLLDLVPRQLR